MYTISKQRPQSSYITPRHRIRIVYTALDMYCRSLLTIHDQVLALYEQSTAINELAFDRPYSDLLLS